MGLVLVELDRRRQERLCFPPSSPGLTLPPPDYLPHISLDTVGQGCEDSFCSACTFQVRKRWAARSTASLTARASPSSPPVTRSAAAAGVGCPACRPALWMSVVPPQTAPDHSTFGYRGNAANSGCVRTWRTPSFRTPSQVGPLIQLFLLMLTGPYSPLKGGRMHLYKFLPIGCGGDGTISCLYEICH